MAIGWTLLHSIWQAVILLVMYNIISKFLNNSTQKYNWGISFLFGQLLISAASFGLVYEPESIINSVTTLQNITFESNAFQNNQTENMPLTMQVLLWLSSKINLIVNLWLIGLVFYTVRFTYNYWQVNELKNNGLSKPNQAITAVFEKLLTTINNSKPIQLMESTQITSPVLIGHFKTIILLPIGLCSHLSPTEIEAILAHELAHLKRNDFLINLLQTLVDILYFFNPALQYLSYQIREERENCCDEFATEICGSSMPIAKALVSLESFRQESALAMAFGRKNGSLKNRIHKILGVSPEKANENKGILMILTFVLLSILYLNIEKTYAKQDPPKKKGAKNSVQYKNGKNYNYYEDNGKRKIVINDKDGSRLTLVQKDGSIFLNDKEYKLSKEDSTKMAYHNAEMEKLEKEMEAHSVKMGDLSTEMGKLSANLKPLNEPMGVKSQEISKLAQKINDLAQNQVNVAMQLAKLDHKKNSKQIAELESKEQSYESEIAKLEEKIEKISAELEEIGSKMELRAAPMDSLGKIMEKAAKPMEEIGKKMEELSKEMWKLYPEEVKAKYGKMMEDVQFPNPPSPPPAPPKAPMPPKYGPNTPPPLPPKAPKAPKSKKDSFGYYSPVAPTEPVVNVQAPTPVLAPTPVATPTPVVAPKN